MHRFRYALAIAGLVPFLVFAESPREAEPALCQPLLRELKLTPATAQLDPHRWAGGGPRRLNMFQKLWDDWRTIDPVAVKAGTDILASADSFDQLIATVSPFIDVNPLPKTPTKNQPSLDFPRPWRSFTVRSASRSQWNNSRT